MSKTTKLVTAGELRLTTLPRKTETYTVISHGFIIDNVKAMLSAKGFEVVVEEYRANNNLEVARGSYIIKRSEDPTFLMSFNWVNSYDKSTKFQCAIGGYVWENNSYVIDKEDNTFIRKHTGDADTLAKETIEEKINNAESHYLKVLNAKQKMQNITVSRQQVAKMLGELYFSYDMISIEQLSGIKKEYNKPSYVYSTNSDSLWTVYCHMLTVIKSSHPKQWLHQQGFIHNYLKMNYLMTADKAPEILLPIPTDVLSKLPTTTEVEVDPAQINLLDAIQEAEEELFPIVEEDLLQYTDPLGVTFEVPVVEAELSELAIERDNIKADIEADIIDEDVRYAENDEESLTVSDPKIISVLQNEVNNIFGYDVEIEVFEDGENYNIVTNDGQEVVVPVDYVNNLI